MNKLSTAVVCLLLCTGILFSFASCGRKKPVQGEPLALDTQPAETTLPDYGAPGAQTAADQIAPNGKKVSSSRALKVYKKAVEGLKAQSPGFTLMQWQDLNGVASDNPGGIVDELLTIVSKNLIRNNSAAAAQENPEFIAKGDAAAAQERLPLFGVSIEYAQTDNRDFISEARAVKTGENTDYYIFFAPELNPVSGGLGMGSLMSPFDRASVVETAESYIPNIEKDTLRFDCVYSGCYLMFRVGRDGKLLHLENHMYAQIRTEASIDLIVVSAQLLRGSCLYEEHYIFSDFIY